MVPFLFRIKRLINSSNLDSSQCIYIPYSSSFCFVYQWSLRLLPPCFSNYFKFTSTVHSYSTRQSCYGNLYLTSVTTTQYGLRSLKFTGSRLQNSLPPCITKSDSLRLFRKALKNSMPEFYGLLSMLNCYIVCRSSTRNTFYKNNNSCILLGSSTKLAFAIWMIPNCPLLDITILISQVTNYSLILARNFSVNL